MEENRNEEMMYLEKAEDNGIMESDNSTSSGSGIAKLVVLGLLGAGAAAAGLVVKKFKEKDQDDDKKNEKLIKKLEKKGYIVSKAITKDSTEPDYEEVPDLEPESDEEE